MRTVFVFSLILSLFLPHSALALDAPDTVISIGEAKVGTDTPTKVGSTDEIKIKLTRPSGSIAKYVYGWTNSDGDPGFDATSLSVANPKELEEISLPGAFFSDQESDYGDPWFFHIKAIDISDQQSTTKSLGAFYFDTIGPVGTIKLTAKAGQDPESDTADSSTVTFEVNLTQDLAKVYLSNTATRPVTPHAIITAYPITYPYALPEFNTAPVNQKAVVYYWYEDEAGNIKASSITLTINEGKWIVPQGAINLRVGNAITFQFNDGGTENFNWSILDVGTGLTSTAASFEEDSSQGVPTVTIKGVTEGGIVKLKAVSIDDTNAVYESGDITIIAKSQSFCLDVNGDGIVHGTTDGFLILRYLLKYSDAQLIAGKVITPDATRRTADDIKTYLASAVSDLSLDINGDGIVHGTTDGFLILRYLLKYSDAQLIAGKVITPDATRRTAEDVKAYLVASKCGLP